MTDLSTPLSSSPRSAATPDRLPRRVRHALRFRRLEVIAARRVTPHLVRVTLAGADLAGFASPGFDDHVKVFFPDDKTGDLRVPEAGPDGPIWPDGVKPTMRDYTPRRFDAAAGTLDIDFALHEAGPATRWAEQARPGQSLGIGGPRGSFIVPTDFDWHLLVGDDTALPAIARRLAELPKGARAVVVAEVDGAADHVPFDSAAELAIHWVHRDAQVGSEPALLAALRRIALPPGDFHAWVGCESAAAKAVRSHLIGDRGANPKWIRASGYWRRGTAATHDKHDE